MVLVLSVTNLGSLINIAALFPEKSRIKHFVCATCKVTI